jgi:hydrogenase nickel incorporation protein HypA/HybF
VHELSIAQSILEIVEQHLPPGNNAGVRSVKLKVGDLAAIVPDSLEFCFSAITAGGPLEGARLDIEHVAITGECRECGKRSLVKDHIFVCPSCQSGNLTIVGGRELQVIEIELFDEPSESL